MSYDPHIQFAGICASNRGPAFLSRYRAGMKAHAPLGSAAGKPTLPYTLGAIRSSDGGEKFIRYLSGAMGMIAPSYAMSVARQVHAHIETGNDVEAAKNFLEEFESQMAPLIKEAATAMCKDDGGAIIVQGLQDQSLFLLLAYAMRTMTMSQVQAVKSHTAGLGDSPALQNFGTLLNNQEEKLLRQSRNMARVNHRGGGRGSSDRLTF